MPKAVDLAARAKNKQLATMILSGAEVLKTAVSESKLTCLTPFLIFYIIREETTGGGARHLLLMAGSLRDDCIDKGTVQLVWLLCRRN